MSTVTRSADPFLYEQVAREVRNLIDAGILKAGDRAPSLRRMSEQARVSIATVSQAYQGLERLGYLEAREKSGFYVRRRAAESTTAPRAVNPRTAPRRVSVGDVVETILGAAHRPDVVSLGLANPSPDLLPVKALTRAMTRVASRRRLASMRYSLPQGLGELRRQIAYRSRDMGCELRPEDLLITSGATEGLATALQVVARSGDAVVVESPCYFQILQLIESLGLLAVEVRTDTETGLDLDALERALERVPVKAVIAVPNFHNPLGALMPDAGKRRLVRMLAERGIPLIEDDVYGDLYAGERRPWTAKAFDDDGNVILCSSFSKTLAPGYRVGWMAPGRLRREVTQIKRALSGTTASLTQLAVSEFLASGGYDRMLRQARRGYASQVEHTRDAIVRHFPAGTRVSRPAGGFVLWVELPEGVDGARLFEAALAEGVSVAPGSLFSPSRKFRGYVRISAGLTWSERVEDAIATVGRLAAGMA